MGMRSRRSSFCSGHLGEDALLELQQQPRHGEEDGRAGALQVGEEGIDPFAEEDAIPQVDGGALHAGPLHDMGQRQVGEHALLRHSA